MSKAPTQQQQTSRGTNQISRVQKMADRMQTALADPNLTPAKREAAQRAQQMAAKLIEQRKARQQATKP